MIDCPFPLCAGALLPIVEQAYPGDDETTAERIPLHLIGGHENFGNCPASLMTLPITEDVALMLREQAATIQRLIDEQGPPVVSSPDLGQPLQGRQGRPGPKPHTPGGDPSWFRNSDMPATPPVSDVEQRPPFRQLPQNGSPATEGKPLVASVPEVRAAIIRATQLEAEAQEAASGVAGLLSEALQLLNWVRETSVDPMGAPKVNDAIEKCDEIAAILHNAIEEATTYMVRL